MSRNVRVVLAEQERDLGIDFVGRRERVGVLRDPLRQHGELVRVFDLAQAAAALADLLRRLLRELEQPAVALVDRRRGRCASDVRLFSLSTRRFAAASTRSQRPLTPFSVSSDAGSCVGVERRRP